MARLVYPLQRPTVPAPPVLSLLKSANQPEDETGGRWVGGFAWEPESRAAAVSRDSCDYSTPDRPALPTPVFAGTNLVAGTSGTLGAATYSYAVTFVNAEGHTAASATATVAVPAGGNGSVAVTVAFPVGSSGEGVTMTVYGRVGGALGLIASGVVPTGSEGSGYSATFTDTGAATPGAAPPVTNTSGGPGTYTPPGIQTYYPLMAMAEDRCSTWGFSIHDFKGRATRLLENGMAKAIGREFSSGLMAQALGYPNNYLQNGSDPNFVDVTPGSVPSITRGIQILEDYLASTGFGGQGMIHVMPQTAPNLLGARRVGDLLLTVLDNIIVPDAGYDGNGPGNAA